MVKAKYKQKDEPGMYNIVELFSGIGSQAKALRNIGKNVNLIATSEWDIHAIIAYDLIHNRGDVPTEIKELSKDNLLELLKEYTFSNTGKAPLDFLSLKTYSLEVLQRLYFSITRNKNFVDISSIDGTELPDDIDVLTYSFPCQDLSNVGAFHGYNKGIDKGSGSRSSLLWQVGRILSEMQEEEIQLPRFLLMENVPTLLSARHFSNFSSWICDLRELGYVSKYYQLNASSFGLPQNRPRLLMISVYVGDNEEETELILDYFKSKGEEAVIDDYRQSAFFHQYTVQDLLRINYDDPEIFAEAVECTPNDTVSRRKIWNENPQIVEAGNVVNEEIEVIRTITTKQDRNPNSGNIFFDSGIEGRSMFRYLTPRECMLFMGFTDEDFEQLKNNNLEFHKGDALFARDKVIRMAGNSIPVKMLEGIFLQIVQIDSLLQVYQKRAFAKNADWSEKKRCVKKITRYLFPRGIRCRAPGGLYPKSPDVVFPAYNIALFVYDCFQHAHGCVDSDIPVVNRNFWEKRIKGIVEEDRAKHAALEKSGWKVLVVWKCELENDKMDETLKRIETEIRKNGNKRDRKNGVV